MYGKGVHRSERLSPVRQTQLSIYKYILYENETFMIEFTIDGSLYLKIQFDLDRNIPS